MMWPFRSPRKRVQSRTFPLYDIHSHMLFGVDDGAADLAEAGVFLKQYAALGYRGVVVTPHTRHPMFGSSTPDIWEERFSVLSEVAASHGISLVAGGEIMCRYDDVHDFDKETFPNVAGAYLVEFENRPTALRNGLEKRLYKLQRSGNIFILAHPERYVDIQQHPELLTVLKQRGVLLQINLGSLCGWFGSRAQKMAWRMVQNGMADIAATDVHQPRDFQIINSALHELEAFDVDSFRRLVSVNPGLVFNGQAAQIESVVGV